MFHMHMESLRWVLWCIHQDITIINYAAIEEISTSTTAATSSVGILEWLGTGCKFGKLHTRVDLTTCMINDLRRANEARQP